MMNEKDKTVRSIEKAMMLLELIAASGGGLRLQNMVNATGISKSTLHGILNTLASLGYIDHRGAEYTLGLRLRDLALPLANADAELRTELSDTLHTFSLMSGETCYLAVACGMREYIYIDAVEGGNNLRLASPRGIRETLIKSAIGKILLSYDPHLIRPLRLSGDVSDKLEKELKKIVAEGYALDLEIAEQGLNCLAVPVIRDGRIIAAIGIAGPASRLPRERLSELKIHMQLNLSCLGFSLQL